MILLDVNILVSALMPSSAFHQRARNWLVPALIGEESLGIWEPLLCSAIRIATLPTNYNPPADMATALEFVKAVADAPSAIRLQPSTNFWPTFRSLVEVSGARGNLITDAMIAALAVENDCVIATYDNDFARFPSVRCMAP